MTAFHARHAADHTSVKASAKSKSPLRPLLAVVVSGVLGFACGGAKTDADSPADVSGSWAGTTRDNKFTHEPCETKDRTVKTFEATNPLEPTKKKFVTQVFNGSKEICSFTDINGDGNIDNYSYFDDSGAVRRRESAYTIDKAVIEISLYKDGELTVVMRGTNRDKRIDTWDFYEGGKLTKRERDKTGEGRIVEWWTYEPAGSDNATIVQADPRTGKPDPSLTIKLGSAAPAKSAAAKPSASTSASAPPVPSTPPAVPSVAPSTAPSASTKPATPAKPPAKKAP